MYLHAEHERHVKGFDGRMVLRLPNMSAEQSTAVRKTTGLPTHAAVIPLFCVLINAAAK